MTTVAAYGTQSATEKLAPLTIERRNTAPHDVNIDILYCGVCHTDLHMARNINEAYEHMLKSDVKYRFVIDNTSVKK